MKAVIASSAGIAIDSCDEDGRRRHELRLDKDGAVAIQTLEEAQFLTMEFEIVE
jgi:hypothetical protein